MLSKLFRHIALQAVFESRNDTMLLQRVEVLLPGNKTANGRAWEEKDIATLGRVQDIHLHDAGKGLRYSGP